MEKEFKIGDRVKTIGNSRYSYVPIGSIGKIINIKGFSEGSAIQISSYEGVNPWIHKGDYEHYQEEIVVDVILEEEFQLPENWYIKITKQNVEIVKKWWNSKNYGGRIWTIGAYYGIYKNEPYSKTQPWTDITEITLDQFEKYVFKEEEIIVDVIEEKFMLPERWCIKITEENKLELKNKLPKIGAGFLINQYIYYLNVKNDFTHSHNWSWNMCQSPHLEQNIYVARDVKFSEITFEQFKTHILKEEIVLDIIKETSKKRLFQIGDKVKITGNDSNSANKIGDIGIIVEKSKTYSGNFRIKVGEKSAYSCWSKPTDIVLYTEIEELPFFKILIGDKEDNSIFRVQNNEGNIFEVGDKVRNTNPFSVVSETMIIKGFRHNKAKSNICAITAKLSDYGIGIDKIEHVIDFKKEEIIVDVIKSVIPENESNLDKAKRLYPKDTIFRHMYSDRNFTSIGLFTGNINDIYARIDGQDWQVYRKRDNKWAEISYNGYKVGDVFTQYGSTPFTITGLETIDGHEIAFYKHPNGHSGPQDRILTKNIKK